MKHNSYSNQELKAPNLKTRAGPGRAAAGTPAAAPDTGPPAGGPPRSAALPRLQLPAGTRTRRRTARRPSLRAACREP